MSTGRFEMLHALFRPLWVKLCAGVALLLSSVATYDAWADQFDWPKLPKVWEMTLDLVPWWGWLLILQAVFVAALFEYVRKTATGGGGAFFDPTPIIDATQILAARLSGHDRDINSLEKSRQDVFGILTKSNEGDQEMLSALGKSIQELFARVSALETAQKNSSNNFDMWSRRLGDDMENRFIGVDQGFSALLDRERLISLTEQIDKDAFELSGPTRGDPLGDFKIWQEKEQKWRQMVVSWCQLAATYRFGASERVHSTPENLYRGAWDAADSLFPNADAIIAWRTFRIIYRNFETESEIVGRAVLMAAFARPSLKLRPAVTRGEDQMPRLPPSTAP